MGILDAEDEEEEVVQEQVFQEKRSEKQKFKEIQLRFLTEEEKRNRLKDNAQDGQKTGQNNRERQSFLRFLSGLLCCQRCFG